MIDVSVALAGEGCASGDKWPGGGEPCQRGRGYSRQAPRVSGSDTSSRFSLYLLGMGKCEAREQSGGNTGDHPPHGVTNSQDNMIQNAPISDMAVDSSTPKTTKTSKDVKSPSVGVKSPNTAVKSTALPENLGSNPTSFLAAIGDSEEYVKPIVKDGEIILEVECGQNKAFLYLSKLCQGSKGPCIYFQTSWLTPNEFQFVSGRETAKDWKRSIRHHGKSLKLLLTKGILSVHPTVCDCEGCRHGSNTPTRCRTGEKRKAPSSQDKKPKKTAVSMEHHANGAFKPVDKTKSGAGSKPSPDAKHSHNQNLPCHEKKHTPEKHCSPLKESMAANVIAPKSQACDRLGEFSPPPSAKKDKHHGSEDVGAENIAIVQAARIPEFLKPAKPPALDIPEPIPKPTDEAKVSKPDKKYEQKATDIEPCMTPVAHMDEDREVQVKQDIKNEVKLSVKSLISHQDVRAPEVACSDINVTDSLCVNESAIEPVPSLSCKIETGSRTSSPEAEPVRPGNLKPQSPYSSSCPSSPEPQEDSEVCRRTLPICPKYARNHSNISTDRPIVHSQASVLQTRDPEKCSDAAKHKTHVHHETKSKTAADEPSPKCLKREADKCSSRSVLDNRTSIEVSHSRQPETGDVAFSDYMRLLAAGHGSQMLRQPPQGIESMYAARPPEMQVNPAMMHPIHACSMYSHPGFMQKDQMYQTTAAVMPASVGAPCFAPMHLMPARVPYAVPPPPQAIMDASRSLQYLQMPGTVPYHCGAMSGLKLGSEIEVASALDLSTSKRLRLEYPSGDYRMDTLSGCHGFQPYGYDYRMNEDLVRNMHAEEAFNQTGSVDFKPYTPSWFDHAGKAVLHRCTCAENRPGDIRFWTVEDVYRFLSMLDGCGIYAENFREQRVDGRILPLLTTDHLMKNLGMKLGPALLVTEAVAKKLQEASKYPGCDSCRTLILGAS